MVHGVYPIYLNRIIYVKSVPKLILSMYTFPLFLRLQNRTEVQLGRLVVLVIVSDSDWTSLR